MSLFASNTPDQFGARSDVAPLVAAAQLEFTVMFLVQVQEVVRLE